MTFSKSNTLVDDYEFISELDPAVDKEVPDFETAWQAYLKGMGDAPLKQGETPTRFILRHLSKRDRQTIGAFAAKHGETDAAWLAAHYAIKGARDLTDSEGKSIRFERVSDDFGSSHLKLDLLDFLPPAVLVEIGVVAFSRAELSDPLS